MVSFTVHELLSLIRSHLFIFAFGDRFTKILLWFMSISINDRSFRSFIVSGLKFRSLIHFEFIFVYGVIKCSSFILLQVVDQFFQHHLLKRLSLYLFNSYNSVRQVYYAIFSQRWNWSSYLTNFRELELRSIISSFPI